MHKSLRPRRVAYSVRGNRQAGADVLYIGAMLALLRRASKAERISLRYACEVSADGAGFRPAKAGCVGALG